MSLLLIAAVIGYLLGAIPCGYLVARAKGVNIFAVGSGSPGATNVRRALGRSAGNLVFVLDVLKGALAACWALQAHGTATLNAAALFGATSAAAAVETCGTSGTAGAVIAGASWYPLGVAGLVGALLGHSFSCFTKFRGGKGVATGAGGVLVLLPIAGGIGAVLWIATFYATRYVSLASMLAALSLPLSTWALGRPTWLVGVTGAIALFVIYRHRENCRRLLAGTENRFTKKQTTPKPTSGHDQPHE